MSCYLRHLNEILREAGIDPEKMDRKEVDQALHRVVSVEYKHCPDTWKAVKAMIDRDREGFIRRLAEELG
jgi:hypothetical protein